MFFVCCFSFRILEQKTRETGTTTTSRVLPLQSVRCLFRRPVCPSSIRLLRFSSYLQLNVLLTWDPDTRAWTMEGCEASYPSLQHMKAGLADIMMTAVNPACEIPEMPTRGTSYDVLDYFSPPSVHSASSSAGMPGPTLVSSSDHLRGSARPLAAEAAALLVRAFDSSSVLPVHNLNQLRPASIVAPPPAPSMMSVRSPPAGTIDYVLLPDPARAEYGPSSSGSWLLPGDAPVAPFPVAPLRQVSSDDEFCVLPPRDVRPLLAGYERTS